MLEPHDFQVSNEGTIWLFTPLNERANTFAQTELGLEAWQWVGDGFAIEHRIARQLVQSLKEEGFEFQK